MERVIGIDRLLWERVVLNGKTTAKIICPKCATLGYIDEHAIGKCGIVAPSIQCANPDCDFHENVRLLGWKP